MLIFANRYFTQSSTPKKQCKFKARLKIMCSILLHLQVELLLNLKRFIVEMIKNLIFQNLHVPKNISN